MFAALVPLLALTLPVVDEGRAPPAAVAPPARTAPPASSALPASPASSALPAPPALTALPSLRDFAAPAAPSGSEGWLVKGLLALLPSDVRVERDAFGSVLVSAGAPGAPCTRVIVVGLDEPGYVVGQVRDDGYLRLRYLGRTANAAFHLAHEGRPALVLPRAALPAWEADLPGHGGASPVASAWSDAGALTLQPTGRPGVVLINSIHLKNPRPATLDEADLWLDVGAEDAQDVASLGIGLLDPVVLREITAFGDRVAGPELGRRAAALALLGALRDVPRAQWRDGLAVAFVAQSLPGPGVLGRGGEGVLRRLHPAEALLLAARDGGADGVARVNDAVSGLPTLPPLSAALPHEDVTWSTLQLRVGHAGTPVESVAAGDLQAFGTALRAEIAR